MLNRDASALTIFDFRVVDEATSPFVLEIAGTRCLVHYSHAKG